MWLQYSATMNLKLLGTSHISEESIEEIKKNIKEYKPDIIAVELDVQRAASLLSERKNKIDIKSIMQIGVKGYLFAKIGQIVQQKLGKMVGISPGSEMKSALLLAKKEKLVVAFIDQPITITLRNFSKALTWREKWRFVKDIIKGLIMPKRQIKEMGLENFDLTKVPAKKVVIKMMNRLKKDYPSIYKTIVEDRNKYMVRSLIRLIRKDPEKKILAIVGAGHLEGMEELLLKVDVV